MRALYAPDAAQQKVWREIAPRPTRAASNPGHPIVGIENCAPSLMPEGQRAVTVLVRV